MGMDRVAMSMAMPVIQPFTCPIGVEIRPRAIMVRATVVPRRKSKVLFFLNFNKFRLIIKN